MKRLFVVLLFLILAFCFISCADELVNKGHIVLDNVTINLKNHDGKVVKVVPNYVSVDGVEKVGDNLASQSIECSVGSHEVIVAYKDTDGVLNASKTITVTVNYGETTTISESIDYAVPEQLLLINNAKDLKDFASAVNAGNDYQGKTIILISDINLNNEEWIPIGQKNGKKFAGTFNGNEKTISGLYISENNIAATDSAFDKYVGLFGAIDGATVKKLTVSGSVKGEAAAGIVARMERGLIEDCTSNVLVEGTDNGKAGGIVCLTNEYDCTIKNCINNGNVFGKTVAGVGGIAAYVNANTTIENCNNNAEIGSSNDKYSGGIAGYVKGSDQITIKDCKNTNKVTAFHNAGGIVGVVTSGNNKTPNITSCVNSGSIDAGDKGHGGGIAGDTYSAIITSCENTAQVNGMYAGGIIGVDAASTITNCNGGTANITSPAHEIGFNGSSFILSVAENESSGRIIGGLGGAGQNAFTRLTISGTDDNIPAIGICGIYTTWSNLEVVSGKFYGNPLAGNTSYIILKNNSSWEEFVTGTYVKGGLVVGSRINVWQLK